jgi:CubicO group peptidase (beta-lactamase class C family)
MRHNAVRITVCGVLLVTAACASQLSPTLTPTPAPTAIPREVISGMDAWLSQQSKDGNFSGSVLVARQDDVLLNQGYGLADRQHNIPNTAQTRFRLGSITKQFTAMAILILAARGKLNVADPICNYIADCPATWVGITIDHLLTHTSGLPDLLSLPGYWSTLATPSPPEQTIARFKDLPLDFQPGETWSYSNSGYIVLGYIIEQASGQSYEDFLQQSIFTPLNLRDTGYDHNSNSLAVGYPDQDSTEPAEFIDMSIPYAAGALYSTVEDLYHWEQALSTEQLVPRVYLDEMFAPHAAIPHRWSSAYGYGWFIAKERGRTLNLHGGEIPGFTTVIARYPDDHVTIIVLSNQQNIDIGRIQDFLSKKIFGDK